MPVSYFENPDTKIAEIVVDGTITRADFEDILPKMRAFIETCGTIRFLEVIEGMAFPPVDDATLIWDGIKFDMYALPRISHCAVVSDMGWLSPLSKAAGTFMSTKLRTFEKSELDTAREWLASAD